MRLILFDLPDDQRINFYPLALSRPIFELRCGMTSLGEKLVAKTGGPRRGLLRAALPGRGLPDEDQPAGQRPRARSRATICCWSTAG